MEVVLSLRSLCDQVYIWRLWRTRQNGESNKIIQVSLLIIMKKSNKQLILAQIIYGKGEHICIDNIKSKKLQPKPWRWKLNLTIVLTSLLHTHSTSFTSLTHNDTLLPPTLAMIPAAWRCSLGILSLTHERKLV